MTNIILIKKARDMMHDQNVPAKLWAEALETAVHIQNIKPSALNQWKIPDELLSGEPTGINHRRIFCSRAEVYVPVISQTKLTQNRYSAC